MSGLGALAVARSRCADPPVLAGSVLLCDRSCACSSHTDQSGPRRKLARTTRSAWRVVSEEIFGRSLSQALPAFTKTLSTSLWLQPELILLPVSCWISSRALVAAATAAAA